jgi:hypothetical protein
MNARYDIRTGVQCTNTCNSVMKGPYYSDTGAGTKMAAGGTWTFPFFDEDYPSYSKVNETTLNENYTFVIGGQNITRPVYDSTSAIIYDKKTSGYVPDNADMTVDYCLIQPVHTVCHVGLSNTLLLGVTICVLLKTATAIVVTIILGRRGQTPLVTLGDAIASFIRRPDKNTAGMCTLDHKEMRRATRSLHHVIIAGPRTWHGRIYRRWKVIPLTVWVFSYLLFALGTTIAGVFYQMARSSSGG